MTEAQISALEARIALQCPVRKIIKVGYLEFTPMTCLVCGKERLVKFNAIQRGRGKYCGRVCSDAAQRGKWKLLKSWNGSGK